MKTSYFGIAALTLLMAASSTLVGCGASSDDDAGSGAGAVTSGTAVGSKPEDVVNSYYRELARGNDVTHLLNECAFRTLPSRGGQSVDVGPKMIVIGLRGFLASVSNRVQTALGRKSDSGFKPWGLKITNVSIDKEPLFTAADTAELTKRTFGKISTVSATFEIPYLADSPLGSRNPRELKPITVSETFSIYENRIVRIETKFSCSAEDACDAITFAPSQDGAEKSDFEDPKDDRRDQAWCMSKQ